MFQKMVRFLGVFIQSKLTGIGHVQKVTAKATKAATDVAKILPRTHGASGDRAKDICRSSPIHRIICRSCVRTIGTPFLYEQRTSARTQRVMAIRIRRSYRTVSTPALLFLARCALWPLRADEKTKLWYERKKDPDVNGEELEKK